jgi:hypothetical protein
MVRSERLVMGGERDLAMRQRLASAAMQAGPSRNCAERDWYLDAQGRAPFRGSPARARRATAANGRPPFSPG